MPGPQQTAGHGTPTCYRRGCRQAECRAAHGEESQRLRREKQYGDGGPMGPKVRRDVLQSLKHTKSVMETAMALGLTPQAIYAAAKIVPEFGEEVFTLTAAQAQ
jgi:hypothetical protein